MGFRFRKRITLVKGVAINLSTTGASLSLGPKGTTVNISKRGVRTTQDLPGSGAYYSDDHSWGEIGELLGGDKRRKGPAGDRSQRLPDLHTRGKKRRDDDDDDDDDEDDDDYDRQRARRQRLPSSSVLTSRAGKGELGESAQPLYVAPGVRLDMGFLQRLTAPAEDEALIDGLKLLLSGDQRSAYEKFIGAARSADGAFLAGVSALQFGIYTDAIGHLSNALKWANQLGGTLRKYKVDCWVSFQLSAEIIAYIRADVFGALLALAEAQQRLGSYEDARQTLRRLLKLAPGDILGRLSLAELLSDEELKNEAAAQELAALGAGVENESELHCALLLYQGRALLRLGMADGAKAVLTKALSKRKDRDKELLLAIRYERAAAHEALSDRAALKADLQRIYSEDPDYEDVAERLEK